ncbi:hypothetical protein MIZ01_1114 [Sideroxyarcus emersonii]|uniref:Uncharacterized protein n=1 Tax=Sideroxyarcus emersonii TaxID=2764705 RepID=A0AAN2BYS8_9PROT|nr:hypothetical protein MIZ01_1114 [Sideroxyarcus emersonii]
MYRKTGILSKEEARQAMRRGIEGEFLQQPSVDGFNVAVTVCNGI